MTARYDSSELGLIKAVFPAYGMNKYLERAEMLKTDHPQAWQEIDFPLEVALELTSHCNLRCVMCPNPCLKREKGYMSDQLFRKILHDITKECGFLFMPQGFGEPLLHRYFPELLRAACESGIKPIVVLSNGMLLNGKNLFAILNSADILIVTIDGVKAETYESIRIGGKLQAVIDHVVQLIKLRGTRERPYLILRMIHMKETEAELSEFKAMWTKKIRETDIIQIVDFNDWAGSVHSGARSPRPRTKRHPCRMLWKNLTVLHNGQVTPCCYDAEGELSIGNVANESLQLLWEGPTLKAIRTLHLEYRFEQIPICRRCNSWF